MHQPGPYRLVRVCIIMMSVRGRRVVGKHCMRLGERKAHHLHRVDGVVIGVTLPTSRTQVITYRGLVVEAMQPISRMEEYLPKRWIEVLVGIITPRGQSCTNRRLGQL